MPPLTGSAEIRSLLNRDRIWALYALGDLMPAAFPKSKWFAPGPALVFRDFGVCIVFAMGAESVEEAMRHASYPVHLQLKPEAMDIVEKVAIVTKRLPMWRMGWSGDRSGFVDTSQARRLTPSDVPALQRLYSDGSDTSEAPDFFFPSMVASGVFYGVFENGEIVAAAGTHLYAPVEGTAAIGNVYTRRDRRGRGLAKAATCATLRALSGLETVGLNVRVENANAIRVYEALGFRRHCAFFEGLAAAAR